MDNKQRTINENTILVCGAYGQAGKYTILELIAKTDYRIIATGRDYNRLEKLKHQINAELLTCKVFDICDSDELRQQCSHVDLLLNCVGPYVSHGFDIAKIAIESGVYYIDIAEEQEHYRRLQTLSQLAESKGVVLATGFGFYPGLSGLFLLKMLNQFKEAENCLMSLFQGTPLEANAGVSSIIGAVLEMNYNMSIIESGKLKNVKPCTKLPLQMPPPFGKKMTMLWPQMEILSLKDFVRLKSFKTSVKIGLAEIPSQFSVRLVRFLKPHKLKITFSFLSKLMRKRHADSFAKSIENDTTHNAIVTISVSSKNKEHKGTLIASSENAMALLSVKAVKVLLSDTKINGLLTPHLMFNYDEVFNEIREENSSLQWAIE